VEGSSRLSRTFAGPRYEGGYAKGVEGMTQLERDIFNAEGKLLDALHAMRVHKYEMAAHYASTAGTMIEAIEAIRQQNEEMRNDQT
jgi:hypothetical protein